MDSEFPNIVLSEAYTDCWECVANSEAFGALTLLIDTDDSKSPPTDAEISVARVVLERLPLLRAEAEPMLVTAYQRERNRWIKRGFEPPFVVEEDYPELNQPSDIWSMLTHPSINVRRRRRDVPKIELLFGTKWDLERSIRVKLDHAGAAQSAKQDSGS